MGKAAPPAAGKRRLPGVRSDRQAAAARVSRQKLAELVLQRPSTGGASTKTLCADLALLRRHLGQPCPHFGKKGVVQLATPAQASDGGKAPAKFNKYAGWVEWQNAVFLWVNASGGSFVNTFASGGRRVNWYVGGARPTEQSPVVRRLLAGAKRGAAKRGAAGSVAVAQTPAKVLLFVRATALEPYVFCGACGYVAHDAGKKGFEFTWKLEDFPALRKAPAFQRFVAGPRPGGPRAAAAAAAASRWA